MRIVNDTWFEQKQKILDEKFTKNNNRSILKNVIPLIFIVVSFVIFANQHFVIATIFFISGFAISYFSKKIIRVSFSDVVAVDLYTITKILKEIDEDDYLKKELKKQLMNLDSDIEAYLSDKKTSLFIDFDEEENEKHLLKLKEVLQKVNKLTENIQSNRDEKEKLRRVMINLAYQFAMSRTFPKQAAGLIQAAYESSIRSKPLKTSIKSLLKKYVIKRRETYWILLGIGLPIALWLSPYYTQIQLSIESRITTSIMLFGGAAIGFLSTKQQKRE